MPAAIALLVCIAPLIWTLASVAALGASLVLAAGLRVQAPETTAVSFDWGTLGDRSKFHSLGLNVGPETSIGPQPAPAPPLLTPSASPTRAKNDAARPEHDGR